MILGFLATLNGRTFYLKRNSNKMAIMVPTEETVSLKLKSILVRQANRECWNLVCVKVRSWGMWPIQFTNQLSSRSRAKFWVLPPYERYVCFTTLSAGPGRFDDRRRGPPPFERRRPAPMDRDYDGIPAYKRSRGPPDFHEGGSPPSGGPKRAPPPFRDDRRGRSNEDSPARDSSRRWTNSC